MKSDRISISYLKWFVFPVFVFFMAAVPLSIYFEPISGDLTRIGHWSERDFGWNKPQPAVSVHANGVSISNPHVLVLGDSFSHPNIWQSYLAEFSQLEILSFQYQDVGCIDNWLHWIGTKQYPNVHTVIIQTVERGFLALFRNLNTCNNKVPKSFEVTEDNITPTRPQSGLILDASYLFTTAVNTLRMAWTEGRIDSDEVRNVPLTTDRLFSNRKSNRLLYFAEDDNKIFWTDKDQYDSVKNLKSVQNDFAKIELRLIVVVVPDKSSVYANYFANSESKNIYPDISEKLKTAGVNHVNLLSAFHQVVGETVDLYLPNDTHLSTQGYKLMASKISDELL